MTTISLIFTANFTGNKTPLYSENGNVSSPDICVDTSQNMF